MSARQFFRIFLKREEKKINKMENELPKRKSTRLQGFDYGKVGAYFITICTQDRCCILSKIVGRLSLQT